MKLYEVRKSDLDTGKILFSANATELGLIRMGARIANGGTSDGSSPLGRQIAKQLERERAVRDPVKPDILWSARCLGNDFKYCLGVLFPTPVQMTRYMETRR